MRSSKFFFVFGAVLTAVALIGLYGCSDDKATTTVQEDPQYVTVQEQTNSYIDSTMILAANALQTVLVANAGSDTSVPVDYGSVRPDTIITDGGWYVVILDDLATAYEFHYRDSIQFRKGTVPQAHPRGADEMSIRHAWSFNTADTTGAFRNYDVRGAYEFGGLNTDQATVNGTSNFQAEARRTFGGLNIRSTYVLESTVSDVVFNRAQQGWQYGCPVSGTVTATATLTFHGDAPAQDVVTTWNIEVTFANGVMNASATSDNATRTYTRTLCQNGN
ncbi:MAG: hypothetical protein AB1644_02625 [Candidatus Zixiibacteriota bacterium]